MKDHCTGKRIASSLIGLGLTALLGLAAVTPALAQGGPPLDGFGGGQGALPDGFGGGQGAPQTNATGAGGANTTMAARGGFGGMNGAPFLAGTVTAVDSVTGALTVTTQSGDTRTVRVGASTPITEQQTISVSDLKVGDRIAVRGVPTGITASQLTAGQMPTAPVAAAQPQAVAAGGNAQPDLAGGPTPVAPSFAAATGTIKALPTATDPHLALTLGQDTVLYLKLSSEAKITRYASLKLSDVKAGDRVLAAGQAGGDGTLTASVVGVNLSQEGLGRNGPALASAAK